MMPQFGLGPGDFVPFTAEDIEDMEDTDVGAVVIDTNDEESLRFDAVKDGLKISYEYSTWVTGSIYDDHDETHTCKSRDGIEQLRDTCAYLSDSDDIHSAVLMDCDDTLMTLHVNDDWYYIRVFIKTRNGDVTEIENLFGTDPGEDCMFVDREDFPLDEFLSKLYDECQTVLEAHP